MSKQPQKIESAEQYVKVLLDSAADAIITSDTHGIIHSFNASACTMFGYTAEEVIGKNLSMLMPKQDAKNHDGYLRHYVDGGEAKIIGIGRDLLAQRTDKTIFPIYLSIAEMKFEGETRFVGIIRDISEISRANDIMKAQEEKLNTHIDELQQFVYVASHDLQEPLRKMMAFGDRLQARIGDDLDEKSTLYLDRMLDAAERMQILIKDLLGLSRVHTLGNKFARVSLTTVVAEVISDLEILIQESKAIIEVDELPTIAADATQMRQLFQNLITNAIKFRLPEAQPIIKINSEDTELGGKFGKKRSCEITVSDNGIGFEQAYAEKIFKPFQRLNGKSEYPGSGIGLAICSAIVKRHNGQISVKSELEQGTKFTIRLPYK